MSKATTATRTEKSKCICGRHAGLRRVTVGFLKEWRAVCGCGRRTSGFYFPKQAANAWFAGGILPLKETK